MFNISPPEEVDKLELITEANVNAYSTGKERFEFSNCTPFKGKIQTSRRKSR